MNFDFVKSGFKYQIPDLLKEFEYQGLGKEHPLTTNPNFDNDIIRVLLQIVNKRDEASINSQIEAGKKQQGPPKPNQSFRPSLIFVSEL